MAVPVVTVTIRVFESDGTPIEGATVKARMTGYDFYNDQIVDRAEENTITDAMGIATIALFPNTLGSRGTAYVFTIRHPVNNRKIFQTVCIVPNNDCELEDIADNLPPQDPAPGFVSPGQGIVVKIAGLYGVRRIYVDAGLEVINPDGVDGDIGIKPAGDLKALEALPTTGVPERIGENLWTQFPITAFGKALVMLNDGASLTAFLNAVPISGGTMTGPLILSGDPAQPRGAATKQFVEAGDNIVQAAIVALGLLKVSKAGDNMTGPLILAADPVNPLEAATKQYIDAFNAASKAYVDAGDAILQGNINALAGAMSTADTNLQANIVAGDALKVNKAGDTMTGPLTLPGLPTLSLHAATKGYVDALPPSGPSQAYVDAADALRVLKAGDTMTGPLVLSGDPTLPLHSVTKQYADTHGVSITNRIINGKFVIDQRNGGAAVNVSNSSEPFGPDRWVGVGTAASGVYTLQREADALTAGDWRLKIAVTTADAALASGDAYHVTQRIEGFHIADFSSGSSVPQPITLAFEVESTIAGTFPVAFRSNGGTRSYVATFTINSPNVREQKVITLTADGVGGAGQWWTNNVIGMQVSFSLGVGSTYQAAAANVWSTGNFMTVAGVTNFMGTVGNTMRLKDVRLYRGSVDFGPDRRLFAEELALCQRYFYKTFPLATSPGAGMGYAGAILTHVINPATNTTGYCDFPVTMRAAPTVSFYNPVSGNFVPRDSYASQDFQNLTPSSVGENGAGFISTAPASVSVQGNPAYVHMVANAEL